MARQKILNLTGIDIGEADDKARPVLEKAKSQVGFVPNMYANMVNVPAVLDTYLHGYEKFRKEAGFSPAEQEVVLLAISHENHCEYCMGAHSMLAAKQSGVPEHAIQALREGKAIDDQKLAALDSFTRTMVRTRGNPSRVDVDRFLDSGFSEQQVLGIVLAIAVKTLSNYSNHLFNTELDQVFADYAWEG